MEVNLREKVPKESIERLETVVQIAMFSHHSVVCYTARRILQDSLQGIFKTGYVQDNKIMLQLKEGSTKGYETAYLCDVPKSFEGINLNVGDGYRVEFKYDENKVIEHQRQEIDEIIKMIDPDNMAKIFYDLKDKTSNI